MATVERFELLHLGEGKTEHLELLDELEPADVVVGVHALAAVEPLHRFEETALLVIADGPLGQPDLRGKLADPVARGRRRRHARQFTSTGKESERRAVATRPALPCRGAADGTSCLSGESLAQPPGDLVEVLAWGGRAVMRRKLDPETVALPARDHVEVGVKDLLAGGRAVGDEEVDRLAAEAGRPECGGDPPRERPHRHGRDLVDVADRRRVLSGNDQRMALGDRMEIEERKYVGALRHEAGLLVALDDPAKDAGGRLGHDASSLIAFASACAPSA